MKIQDQVEELQRDLKKINSELKPNHLAVREAISKKQCLAEISLPCSKNQGQVVDLKMDLDEMRQLLQHF